MILSESMTSSYVFSIDVTEPPHPVKTYPQFDEARNSIVCPFWYSPDECDTPPPSGGKTLMVSVYISSELRSSLNGCSKVASSPLSLEQPELMINTDPNKIVKLRNVPMT